MGKDKLHPSQDAKNEKIHIPYEHSVYAISTVIVVIGLREDNLKVISVGLGLAALEYVVLRLIRASS